MMTPKNALMIHMLMNRFHQGSPESLLSALQGDEAQEILKIGVSSQDISQAIPLPQEIVKQIHYSWLGSIVQKTPKKMQSVYLSSLPSSSAKQLSQTLNIPLHPQVLAPAVRLYLIQDLYRKLKPSDVLPAAFLPVNSLTGLLSFSKEDLINIIDFLGLYDLAEEIRHIVDKRYLKAIYSCLTIKKQHFLRICLHQKGKLTTSRLGLEKWQGDKTQLNRLLHKRGLLRLGKALAGLDPHFVWHLVHRLDIGRGNFLNSYYVTEEIPGVSQVLTQQILNLMTFFKRMSEP
jgi:hypothetical protein